MESLTMNNTLLASKKWRDENPERMAELRAEWYERNPNYHKNYYQRNKERLGEKHHCNCGGHYSTSVRSKHFKSKKHIAYLSTMRKYFNALKDEEHILLSKPNLREQLEWERFNKVLRYSVRIEFRTLCSMYNAMEV